MLSASKSNRLLLLVIVSIFWIGYPLFFGQRIVDIVIFIAFLFCLREQKKVHLVRGWQLYSFLLLCSYFIITWCLNFIVGNVPSISGFYLFSKILFICSFVYIISVYMKGLSLDEYKKFVVILLFIFLSLCSWAIFYVVFHDSLFAGWHPRPSFPFIKDTRLSDAHLLAAYFAISLIFFSENLGKFFERMPFFVMPILLCFGSVAIIATGSRIALAIIIFWVLIKASRQPAFLIKVIFILLCFILVFFLFVQDSGFDYQLDRLFSFSFEETSSIGKRLVRFLEVFRESGEYYYIFGKSLLYSDVFYFDGVISFLLANFGILGPVAFASGLIFVSYNFLLTGRTDRLLLGAFMVSLLASEFFLISRFMVPVVFYFYISRYSRFSKISSTQAVN